MKIRYSMYFTHWYRAVTVETLFNRVWKRLQCWLGSQSAEHHFSPINFTKATTIQELSPVITSHSCSVCPLKQILGWTSPVNSTLQTPRADITRTPLFFSKHTLIIFPIATSYEQTLPRFADGESRGTQESQTLSKPRSQVLADLGADFMSPWLFSFSALITRQHSLPLK